MKLIKETDALRVVRDYGKKAIDEHRQLDPVDDIVAILRAIAELPEALNLYEELLTDLRGHGPTLCNTCMHRYEPEVCENYCSDCDECPKYIWRGDKVNG